MVNYLLPGNNYINRNKKPIKKLSDEEIINKLNLLSKKENLYNNTEKQYIEEIYVRYYWQVYQFALYYGLKHNDAEDAVHESFIRMIKYKSSFKNGCSFKPWFFKLAYHIIMDKHYNLKKHQYYDINSFIGIDNKNDNLMENTGNKLYLEYIIGRLPERMKAVIILKAKHDMNCNEICKKIGLGYRSTVNLVNKAYHTLKNLAEAEYDYY
jgi:RNA polymerase sigma factor (sigma-70 family)